jgi:hypothetical protein
MTNYRALRIEGSAQYPSLDRAFDQPEMISRNNEQQINLQPFEHRFLEILIIMFSSELHLLNYIVEPSHDIIQSKCDLEELNA